MSGREHVVESHPDAVIFRSPRNWTAVGFFGALGMLHLAMATTSMLARRWEAHMSVVFGGLFLLVTLGCYLVRRDVIVRPERRRITVRTGWAGWGFERSLPFSAVTAVRVTLLADHDESCVTIVCAEEDLELPVTATPRQQGLLLARMLGVALLGWVVD
jgi:hypothetical protein